MANIGSETSRVYKALKAYLSKDMPELLAANRYLDRFATMA